MPVPGRETAKKPGKGTGAFTGTGASTSVGAFTGAGARTGDDQRIERDFQESGNAPISSLFPGSRFCAMPFIIFCILGGLTVFCDGCADAVAPSLDPEAVTANNRGVALMGQFDYESALCVGHIR